jgi:hypothetical protein
MKEETDPSPEYIRGFNQMYKLKQDMPDVAQQLLTAQTEDDRFRGMKAAAKQFELERIRNISKKGHDQTREPKI